jgi:hypothetical protein
MLGPYEPSPGAILPEQGWHAGRTDEVGVFDTRMLVRSSSGGPNGSTSYKVRVGIWIAIGLGAVAASILLDNGEGEGCGAFTPQCANQAN